MKGSEFIISFIYLNIELLSSDTKQLFRNPNVDPQRARRSRTALRIEPSDAVAIRNRISKLRHQSPVSQSSASG